MGTGARATDVNAVLLNQPGLDLYGNPIEKEPASYWMLFNAALDHRISTWTEQDFFYYDAGSARRTFSKTFSFSARDAMLESDFPMMTWLRDRPGFLAGFLWNSLDNSEEEDVSPLDASYRPAEHSWWKTQSSESHLLFGVRPFRTDPYAYASWRIKYAERVLFLGDLRYYFRNFGDHCFELTLSAPITPDISVQLGTSYQFGMHQTESKLAFKVLKTFKFGGIVHVGLELQHRPTLVAAITLPWG